MSVLQFQQPFFAFGRFVFFLFWNGRGNTPKERVALQAAQQELEKFTETVIFMEVQETPILWDI